MDRKKFDLLVSDIKKKEGDGAVYSVDSPHAVLKIPRWSTGIADLDAVIGGGMPAGRVIEIYGAEGSGKTTLLYHLLGMHDAALDIPIEGTFDMERAKIFGNRDGQLYVYRAKYGEDACNKIVQFAQTGIPLIGVDSVPSMLPKEDVEKIKKASQKDSIEEFRIGGVARLLTRYLPVIEEHMELSGTTLVLINQIRDKIGGMGFGEQTVTTGGHKLKHACSIRIKVARKAWIEVPNKNPSNSAEREKVGLILKCKVTKSKVCNPLGECELPVIFDYGFCSFAEMEEHRQRIMKENREKYGKKVVE
jgi:recombination protein RecA